MAYMLLFGTLSLSGEGAGFSAAILVFGLLFILLGYALPKVPFNTAGVGIKLPWIMHDERAWKATHRVSGALWVIGGIISVAFAFLPTSAGFVISYFVLFYACVLVGPLVVSLRAAGTGKQKY